MPNRLAQANSPYLLQHAHNPVDWYPWGEEALARARTEDKPIFLSIGYAACHWCHVMERESFEDPTVAAFMNAHFINIKVDREERPDLDSVYMAATVALTGSGGWPMSVFLTPDLRPFYAGTYFPPTPRYNLPSFRNLLEGIANAWGQEKTEVQRIASQVTAQIQRQNPASAGGLLFSSSSLAEAAKHLRDTCDWGFGGWGDAPKFPQPMTIEFLLRLGPENYPAALRTLDAMAQGGMYDVVGGGFSRYSTDNLWRVPHFEKMLSDNAQLARAYLHAWQITRKPFYRRIAEESLDFLLREMKAPEGGFYSSLDADSEGEEGKFYTWQAAELTEILGAEAAFFRAAYDVTEKGNWQGRTILRRVLDDAALAARFGLPAAALAAKLADCHRRLLAARETRVRPRRDDKILTAWNGLTLSAFAEAARLLERPDYLEAATQNADFLLTALRPEGRLRRAWRAGKASSEVFLEDYAALLLGLLDLYETDFAPRWFRAAQELAAGMLAHFSDPAGGFFDTPQGGEALLLRPKDLQDNAIPSGNALAVEGLLRLAAFTENADFRAQAEQAFALVTEAALRYPTAFARWLGAAAFAQSTIQQVAILGPLQAPETAALLQILRENFQPNRVTAASGLPLPEGVPALLQDRPLLQGKPTAYVCQGFVCQTPVNSAAALRELL